MDVGDGGAISCALSPTTLPASWSSLARSPLSV